MDVQVRGRTVRRLATAAAFGSGGVGLLGTTAYGLLKAQASLARRTVDARPLSGPPNPDGWYGSGTWPAISFVIVGDSAAAGLGVDRAGQTPGAILAHGLAGASGRRVRLTTLAQVGATTVDLDAQIDDAVGLDPDVALVIVGTNDITTRVPLADSVRLLDAAVERLRDVGSTVVVGTCPDLGTVRPIRPPLRWLVRRASRRLAAAQTVAAVRAGAYAVPLGPILGPEFSAAPHELFSEDQFHPSAAGYASAAAAMLPSLIVAMRLSPADRAGDRTLVA